MEFSKKTDAKVFKCDQCDFQSKYKCRLNSHIDGVHLKEKNFKCGDCDYGSHSKGLVRSHYKLVHLKHMKHNCHVCSFKSRYLAGTYVLSFQY